MSHHQDGQKQLIAKKEVEALLLSLRTKGWLQRALIQVDLSILSILLLGHNITHTVSFQMSQ
jgi:hypothetical protein